MKGGPRPGSGRKPLPPEDQTRPRSIRLNDADWEDAKFVGMDLIRDYIRRAAKKKRASVR